MAPSARLRVSFAALALSTIVLGLLLQRARPALPVVAGDALGDALWASMIYWIVGGIRPSLSRSRRVIIALLACWSVELSQLYHAAWIDGWRRTTLGHLVLGTDFDARDLVAYAVGIAVALMLERTLGPHTPAASAP